jgi:beta-1,4-mannosyl-glycoprotein beta-1,4-N-acetylglucosaminyltransferase
MKIFDCTTFFKEKMMMDIRFNILNEYVSKFIVVESCFSHSGQKKELNFDINDYPKFKEKIEYIVIENEPKDLFKDEELRKSSYHKRLNSIKRIEQSYDHMSYGLDSADDNDLILLSDNDEIPNLSSSSINDLKNTDYVIFKQLFFYYKFNLFYDRIPWFGTKGCKKKKLKKFSSIRNLKNKRYPFWRLDTYFSDVKQNNLKIVEKGGWHFTNIKTPEELFDKFVNFGHHDEFELTNIDLDKIKEKISNKEVFYDHLADKGSSNRWSDNYKLKKIDLSYLPKYLAQNSEKFKDWLD